jgi:integrase
VFAIAAELGTVRGACRAMGIHPWTYYRWKRQLDRHGPEILAQSPCRNVPLPKIEREEMRFLTPAEIVDLAETIHARYRALVFVGAYGGLRIGELAGLRPSRVDLRAGAVTVVETLTEVKGKLIAGPPKTRAGRRTVGLPPFVVHELEAHLPPRSGPAATSSPPPVGALQVPSFRARFGCRLPSQPAYRACASTTFATPPWRCGSPPARRPRRSPCVLGPPRSASPWTATATRRSPSRSRRAGAIQ